MTPFERGARCAVALHDGVAINARWMVEQLGMSLAQAKRDMIEIERVMPVRREHGVLMLMKAAT